MKIAIVNAPTDRVVPPHLNRSGLWSYKIAQQLQHSAEMTIFAGRQSGQPKTKQVGQVNYRFFHSGPDRLWQQVSTVADRWRNKTKPFFSSTFYQMPYALRVAEAVRKGRFDIIHIHDYANFVPVMRAFNPNTPIVLHMSRNWLSQLNKKQMAQYMQQCNLVLATGKAMRDAIRHSHPEQINRIDMLNQGVDTTFYHPEKLPFVSTEKENESVRARRVVIAKKLARGQKHVDKTVFATVVPQPNRRASRKEARILYVGAITEENGVHDLISAFGQLAPSMPQAKLILAEPMARQATQPMQARNQSAVSFQDSAFVEKAQAQLPTHLQARVEFIGPLLPVEMAEQYRRCTLVANASYVSTGKSCLAEAGACGKPVVATRLGDSADIVVDGETGYLVECGDVYLLAQSIAMLLLDFDEQLRMGSNARLRIKHFFAWQAIAKSALQSYQGVLNRGRWVENIVPSTV